MKNEFEFINSIRTKVLKRNRKNTIGDDCAIIRPLPGNEILITSDLLVENIDFRREWSSPEDIGHKSLAVSLSDVAAMGAVPRYAMLSLGVPLENWSSNFLDRFYRGWFKLADQFGVELIGGDVSRSPDLFFVDSIVLGEAPRGKRIMRSGAKPGDVVYVSGNLGGAAAGLEILEKRKSKSKRIHSSKFSAVLKKQLHPNPRVELGKLLGESRLVSSMIDLSDGLSSDLAHICEESGVGALIEAAKVPVDARIEMLSHGNESFKFSKAPIEFALHGGEDFELLFTCAKRNSARIRDLCGEQITQIGTIVDKNQGTRIIVGEKQRPLKSLGFRHF